jgi:hypothetical protein
MSEEKCECKSFLTLWQCGRWSIEQCTWGCRRVTLERRGRDGITRVILVLERPRFTPKV